MGAISRALLATYLLLGAVAGCTRNSDEGRARSTPSTAATVALPSPAPTWANYPALDYAADHKHVLTRADVAAIRRTLAALRPCQRQYLRYAFPVNPDGLLPFVLFMDRADVEAEHVLYTNNLYIDRFSGEAFPASGYVPKWNGVQRDAAAFDC
jgi:hypothetical protein